MKKELNLNWIWKQSKGSRFLLVWLSIVSLVMSVCYILITLIFKGFMDLATGESSGTFPQMIVFSVASIVLYAFTQILSSVLEGYAYSRIEKEMRISLIQKIIHKRLLDIHKLHTGEVLNRLTSDIAGIVNLYMQFFGQMCLLICTFLLAVIFMFLLNWKMAIMFLIVIPSLTFLISIFSPKLQSAAEADLKNEDNNRIHMQEILSRLPLFQVYSMERMVDENMDALYERKRASKIQLSLLQGSFGFLNSLMSFSIFILASGVGAYFVLRGENRVGDLVAMIQLSNYVMQPIMAAPGWIVTYNGAKASMKRIQEVEEMADKELVPIKQMARAEIECVVLNDLTFSFDGTELVLDHISATMERGKITGIIGESGSGKTTLLNLILGLYPVKDTHMIQAGRAGSTDSFYGGKENISYVPSENFVFRGTVKENICMSLPYEKEKFQHACALANIDRLIQRLKGKENELLEEGGNNLSMGQKQRVAIARALYGNPPVIVFDEPTASLDPDSVAVFKEMIRQIAEDKICIIVTHDMEVASVCDKVYELRDKSLYS